MMRNRPDKAQLYYPTMPALWWLKKRNYLLFWLREVTSVFIAIFLLVFLVKLFRLSQGSEVHLAFAETLRSPAWIVFHVVALGFAVYHSITWFISSAVVLSVRIGAREVPRWLIGGAHIGAWVVATVAILALYTALAG